MPPEHSSISVNQDEAQPTINSLNRAGEEIRINAAGRREDHDQAAIDDQWAQVDATTEFRVALHEVLTRIARLHAGLGMASQGYAIRIDKIARDLLSVDEQAVADARMLKLELDNATDPRMRMYASARHPEVLSYWRQDVEAGADR